MICIEIFEMAKTDLQRQLKRKKEELKVLYQISESVSNNLNLDEVLRHIIETVQMTVRADSCFLYLWEDKKLVLKASKNPHPQMVGKVSLKAGEGLTGWAAEHKKPVVLSEKAWEDPRFKFIEGLPEDKYEAFYSLPIMHKKSLVGVMNIQHKKPHKYSADEKRLLTIVANQVGGAISNAKLLAETVNLKLVLESRKLIEKAKGILMQEQNLTEDQAYKLIHKKSMDARKSMKEVAEAVLLYADLQRNGK